jgi:hypothetical protein
VEKVLNIPHKFQGGFGVVYKAKMLMSENGTDESIPVVLKEVCIKEGQEGAIYDFQHEITIMRYCPPLAHYSFS